MSDTGPRWRWRVIRLLDRRKDQCWSALVSWALNWYPDETPWWRPSQPQRLNCAFDAARNGSCYCGKLTEPAAPLLSPAEKEKP